MTDFAEHPGYVDGPDGPLFAMLTSPEKPVASTILCSGGWHGGSIQSNRLFMRLGNTLAAAGRNVVRFDWHGTGESPEHIRRFDLKQPFVGDAVAVSELIPKSADLPVSLVGICFGARSALAAAPAIKNLESIVLVSFPFPSAHGGLKRASRVSTSAAMREGLRPSALKGWFHPATRRVYIKFLKLRWRQLKARVVPGSSDHRDDRTARRQETQAVLIDELIAQIGELIQRRVRVLFVFGAEDAMYERWQQAQRGELRELLAGGAGMVDVSVIEGDLYGFSSLDAQSALISTISNWLIGYSVTVGD